MRKHHCFTTLCSPHPSQSAFDRLSLPRDSKSTLVLVPAAPWSLNVCPQATANIKLESELERCQKVSFCISCRPLILTRTHISSPQELCASVALHASNEEDILLRALSVINEKKQRLRAVKAQLADVQSDFKVFKERTAAAASAAAAAQASSPLKKRPKISVSADAKGCSSQSEPPKEISGGKKALDSVPPKGPSSTIGEGTSARSSAMRDAPCAEPRAAAAEPPVASAPEPAQFFSQSSQHSVSTQELTKNFPWANLGL